MLLAAFAVDFGDAALLPVEAVSAGLSLPPQAARIMLATTAAAMDWERTGRAELFISMSLTNRDAHSGRVRCASEAIGKYR